ncbi:MAG: CHAT domain-containing protein, partial [Planctomycetia bacterium]
MADLLLTPAIQNAMHAEASKNRVLVVIHDASASRFPWETLMLGKLAPAIEGGLSRRPRVVADVAAKWLERRRIGETLDVLLIVDSRADLPGARAEGDQILDLQNTMKSLRVVERRGAKATREQILKDLSSGEFDVLHVAGHAFFDPARRDKSGFFCAGGEVMCGADLAPVPTLPALVYLNACESARFRGDGGATPQDNAAGVAETLIRGGLTQFVGTYWPVDDQGAAAFAAEFYAKLLAHTSVDEAVRAGRQILRTQGCRDWANYMHFGAPGFQVKVDAGD